MVDSIFEFIFKILKTILKKLFEMFKSLNFKSKHTILLEKLEQVKK